MLYYDAKNDGLQIGGSYVAEPTHKNVMAFVDHLENVCRYTDVRIEDEEGLVLYRSLEGELEWQR
jgi:hypothetical protein